MCAENLWVRFLDFRLCNASGLVSDHDLVVLGSDPGPVSGRGLVTALGLTCDLHGSVRTCGLDVLGCSVGFGDSSDCAFQLSSLNLAVVLMEVDSVCVCTLKRGC